MAELDDQLTRTVDALRAKRSPPPGAQARVRASLEAGLGDPGAGGSGPEPDDPGFAPSGGGRGVFAAKVVAATAGLTGGGLLGLKLGVLALRSLNPGDGAVQPPPIEQGVAVVAPREEPAASPERPVAEPLKVVDVARPRVDAAPSPKHRPTPSSASSSTPEPDIAAELELIDAARRADSPKTAITQLREHAQRFPSGALRDEREALWAIASCELDDLAEAQHKYLELSGRRPSSLLLDRIAKACPAVKK